MSSISAGTTTTTGYVVTSDTTGALVLKTGASATTALTIDTSQNVGIGTSSPASKLHVSGGRTLAITGNENYSLGIGRESNTNAYYLGVHSTTNPNLLLSNNAGTTNMTLTYDGNLGLGVTPSPWYTLSTVFQSNGYAFEGRPGTTDYSAYWTNAYLNAAGSAFIYRGTGFASVYLQAQGVHRWRTAPSGSAGGTATFTEIMTLSSNGTNSSTLEVVTQNAINSTATLRLNSTYYNYWDIINDSNLRFSRGGTERARIDSNGDFLIGTTTGPSGNVRLWVNAQASTNAKWAFMANNATGGNLVGFRGDGAVYLGLDSASPYNLTIASAANAVLNSDGYLYRSTSSLKYKKDVESATHGLAEVMQLRPVTYQGKAEADGDKVFGGLIAEEVHATGLTEFVQYAEDGTPDALAYGHMVSLAFKAIQEQQALIESLTQRIAALEGQ